MSSRKRDEDELDHFEDTENTTWTPVESEDTSATDTTFLETEEVLEAAEDEPLQRWKPFEGAENPIQDTNNKYEEEQLLDIEKMWRTESAETNDPNFRRIHILGVGSVGTFIAYALRGIMNPPPITLLVHKNSAVREWKAVKESITFLDGSLLDKRTGYDLERIPDMRQWEGKEPPSGNSEPITNLIVAVKTYKTVSSLESIKHRLGPESTICFMQNGMGVIDEVNAEVFPDPATRPRYLTGVISHGLFSDRKFQVHHRGKGTIVMSIQEVPLTSGEETGEAVKDGQGAGNALWIPSSRYLMRTCSRTPMLTAIGLRPKDLLTFQLEKLAVNCIINPLTAIFDCTNGELLYNKHARAIMRLLIAEIALVIRSLPELRASFPPTSSDFKNEDRRSSHDDDSSSSSSSNDNINHDESSEEKNSESPPSQPQSIRRSKHFPGLHFSQAYKFSPERLEFAVQSVARQTWANRSSMLRDVDEGRPTELAYLNGYVVRRGQELGLRCVMNFMVAQMVETRRHMLVRRRAGMGPTEKWTELSDEAKLKLATSRSE